MSNLMIDRAAVRRHTSSRNSMGATVKTLAAAHLTDEPCRLDFLRRAREIGPNAMAEVGDPLIFMNAVDVKQGDMIELTAEGGETMTVQALSVAIVRGFTPNHIEIIGKLVQ